MTSLFDHGSAPAGAQFLDGAPGIKVCTTFTFHNAGVGVAGQVTEVWFYVGANNGGTWTAVGFEVTAPDSAPGGTQIASQAFSGTPTANAWNKVTFSSPVNIPADYNRRWRFGVHNGQYYWANNNFFNTTDYTNSPITAYRDNDTTSTIGVIFQGTFAVGSSTSSYPGNTGTKANYGIDVTFIASGGTTPVGSTLSTPWNIRAAVSRSLDAPWNIRGLVGRSLSTPWAVRASVGRTLDTPWAQRASVGRTLDSPWNIRGAAGRALDLPWAIRSQIGRTLGTPWIIRAKVTSTLQMLWVVEGAPESPTLLPSVGRADLTGHVTSYPDQIKAYL